MRLEQRPSRLSMKGLCGRLELAHGAPPVIVTAIRRWALDAARSSACKGGHHSHEPVEATLGKCTRDDTATRLARAARVEAFFASVANLAHSSASLSNRSF